MTDNEQIRATAIESAARTLQALGAMGREPAGRIECSDYVIMVAAKYEAYIRFGKMDKAEG